MQRTRIKFCGLTRPDDIQAAVAAGADAIGFVFYEKSKRFVTADQAQLLMSAIPAFVTSVGLFVNCPISEISRIVNRVPVSMLQFHGDETPEQCAQAAGLVNRPYLMAKRVGSEVNPLDLLEYETRCRAASALFAGLLLDAPASGYGGSGKVFDWSIIPKELAPRVVLSGGLHVQNVRQAISLVHPYAVDVSSGIEAVHGQERQAGLKDAQLMAAFAAEVRSADEMESY